MVKLWLAVVLVLRVEINTIRRRAVGFRCGSVVQPIMRVDGCGIVSRVNDIAEGIGRERVERASGG